MDVAERKRERAKNNREIPASDRFSFFKLALASRLFFLRVDHSSLAWVLQPTLANSGHYWRDYNAS
ncbi:hypothetical protein QTP70_013542 [Hemibagrus guttatus]|uniref:Uncharacterized protein n=1 Tax=Hemibagrus guttatus TaxID=175788 RepID=A0AAE0UII0_9TELE|nr:hypothetical protein QTP70_013542 [Hemibagrus guttatus]